MAASDHGHCYRSFLGKTRPLFHFRNKPWRNKPWLDYELTATITQPLTFQNLQLENQRLAYLVRVQHGRILRQELEGCVGSKQTLPALPRSNGSRVARYC